MNDKSEICAENIIGYMGAVKDIAYMLRKTSDSLFARVHDYDIYYKSGKMDRKNDLIASENLRKASSRLAKAYISIRENFMEQYGYDPNERVEKYHYRDGKTDVHQIFFREAFGNHIEMRDEDFEVKKKETVSSSTDGEKKD